MTLRDHLEAIRDNHAQDGSGTCGWCDSSARCPDYDNAVAALKLLDNHWHAEANGLPYQDTCRCGLMDMEEYQPKEAP